MTPHIIFKFASRSRPNKFFSTLDNIHARISDKENFTILCSLDEDDKSMTNHFMSMKDFAKYQAKYPNTIFKFGQSKNKISAINRDIATHEKHWDILVNVSDDMEFVVDGFDNEIRNDFKNNYDQCLHYPDGNHKVIITLSILGVDYYKRNNYIYNPLYTSLWSDNEQTIEAIMIGKYRFIDKQLFSHNHPAHGKGVTDEQYRHTESYYHIDKDVFDERKSNNFGLPPEFIIPSFYPNSNTAV